MRHSWIIWYAGLISGSMVTFMKVVTMKLGTVELFAILVGAQAAKTAKKGHAELRESVLVQADQRQVLSLRKQFLPVEQEVLEQSNATIQAAIAANDGHYLICRTSVLTSKRA